MYPNTPAPQYEQQQQPYPAAPFAGVPGYGAPPPGPAPSLAPPPPPARSTPQPMVINIQQNAAPSNLAAPASVQPAPSQQALREFRTSSNFIYEF